MEWKVYILFSDKMKRTYTGCSRDVGVRLNQHNSGKVKATKSGVPWELVYEEVVCDSKEARKRERYYKNASGRKKIFEILKVWRDGRVVERARLESV